MAGQDYSGIINAMRPDERQALESGYVRSRHPGSISDFFKEQADLYDYAKESDPRFHTWFYGDTLDRFKGRKGPFPSLTALKTLRSQ